MKERRFYYHQYDNGHECIRDYENGNEYDIYELEELLNDFDKEIKNCERRVSSCLFHNDCFISLINRDNEIYNDCMNVLIEKNKKLDNEIYEKDGELKHRKELIIAITNDYNDLRYAHDLLKKENEELKFTNSSLKRKV